MQNKKTMTIKRQNGEVVASRMREASNFSERLMGLMFSSELPDCDGLLLNPCRSIHTFFMLYPIDVLFLDQDFRVVKTMYELSPWRMTWIYFRATQVLEMKAGSMPRGIERGEKLEVTCIS